MLAKETQAVRISASKCLDDFPCAGPLITKEPGDFYSLIGVVSFGVGCADPEFPGVYARVTDDLTWIKENMKGTTCPLPRKRRYPRFTKK